MPPFVFEKALIFFLVVNYFIIKSLSYGLWLKMLMEKTLVESIY